MSTKRVRKDAAKPGQKQQPARRPAATTEVQPISPLGLAGAVGAAVLIAAVLLFVINTRLSGSMPVAVAPTPTTVVVAPANTPPPAAPQPVGSGGFSKGSADAKVTVVEYSDFG